VHEAENGQDIQITRHGKPVAIIISLKKYNALFKSEKAIFLVPEFHFGTNLWKFHFQSIIAMVLTARPYNGNLIG
jgi:prevent-host-death family protein